MNCEFAAMAGSSLRRGVVIGVCLAAFGGCAQQGFAPAAQFGQSTTLCADQAAPRGHVVVAKRRDFDCGSNAYDSWQWADLRNAAPGAAMMVCRDPTVEAGLLPRGWVVTGRGDVSASCGPWGDNARVQIRYQP